MACVTIANSRPGLRSMTRCGCVLFSLASLITATMAAEHTNILTEIKAYASFATNAWPSTLSSNLIASALEWKKIESNQAALEKNNGAKLGMAMIDLKLEHTEEALRVATAILSEQPSNHVALMVAGIANVDLKNGRQAFYYFERGARLGSQICTYYSAVCAASVVRSLDTYKRVAPFVVKLLAGQSALPEKDFKDLFETMLWYGSQAGDCLTLLSLGDIPEDKWPKNEHADATARAVLDCVERLKKNQKQNPTTP